MKLMENTMLEAKLSENEIRRIYGKMSGFYDFWANLTEAEARKIALKKSRIQDGTRILEVAVGTGILFEEIVEKNPNGQNIGLDLTEEMLEKAKERLLKSSQKNYELEIGNALRLRFEDDKFDLLFNCYMLDLLSFEKIDAVLEEFKRVLKPGGKLVLVNMTEGKSLVSQTYKMLYKISPRLIGGCRGLQMREKVLEKGFKIEHFEYVEQFLFPSEVMMTKKK